MLVKTKRECEAEIKQNDNEYGNPVLDNFKRRGSTKHMKEGIDCGARYTRYSKIATIEDE